MGTVRERVGTRVVIDGILDFEDTQRIGDIWLKTVPCFHGSKGRIDHRLESCPIGNVFVKGYALRGVDLNDGFTPLVITLKDRRLAAHKAEKVVAAARTRRIAVASLDDTRHAIVGAEHAHTHVFYGPTIQGIGDDRPNHGN